MKKLLLALALCSMALPVHGNDFSESVDKDLARQCYKTMEYISSEEYGIKIKRQYRYYPAENYNEEDDQNSQIFARIKILFNVSSDDDELWSSCYFNYNREVVQFGDPWHLGSNNNRKILIYFEPPQRFK